MRGAAKQARPPSQPAALEVVKSTLFAVGGGVPGSLSVSWLPPGRPGWIPVQCFVLRDGVDALVLDCGLSVHTEQVAAGLSGALAGAGRPRLLVSRWEPDAMANLPWLMNQFGITQVLSYGGINPLDFFESFEAAAAQSAAKAVASPTALVALAIGDVVKVGRLRIEVLATSLRLLLTNWFYEHTTQSLFTADSFGLLSNKAAPCPFVARPTPGEISPAVLIDSLMPKFDWLAGAHCEALIADLQAIQSRYPIKRICPTIGGVIEGHGAIVQLFHSTVSALQQLSREPPPRALAGFDWQRALSPAAVVDVRSPERIPAALRQSDDVPAMS